MNHLRWDGHPLLLESLKQLTHICRGVHSASNASLQLVASVWPGGNLDVAVGEELCDVACCMGSGTVVLKYSDIQRLIPEIKRQEKKKRFYF